MLKIFPRLKVIEVPIMPPRTRVYDNRYLRVPEEVDGVRLRLILREVWGQAIMNKEHRNLQLKLVTIAIISNPSKKL